MDIRELRIGSLVLYKDRLVEVLALDARTGAVIAGADKDREWSVHAGDLRPVRLTDAILDEVLERDPDKPLWYRCYLEISKETYRSEGREGCLYLPVTTEDEYYVVGCAVHSLHVLQDLYRAINGEELEIKRRNIQRLIQDGDHKHRQP